MVDWWNDPLRLIEGDTAIMRTASGNFYDSGFGVIIIRAVWKDGYWEDMNTGKKVDIRNIHDAIWYSEHDAENL